MLNLKYERVKAADLKPGDLFATYNNPGVQALKDAPLVNIGPPPGAIGFGHYHVRTDEQFTDQADADAPCYRITIEVL